MFRRISYVPWPVDASLVFRDLCDTHFGKILPVAYSPAVSLPALHLEHEDLLVPELSDDRGTDLGALNHRRADRKLVTAEEQYIGEGDRIALFCFQLLYAKDVTLFYLVLLPACPYNRIHDAPRKHGCSKNEELLMKVLCVVKEFP